jgi:hypothetical protein
METTRPDSIIWFERLYIGSLAVSVAIMVVGWDAVRSGAIPPFYLVAGLFVGLVLPVILVLLVSRRRSGIAKWILFMLFAVGLAANVATYRPGMNWRVDLAALLITGMQIAAIGLLFTASARTWLGGKDGTLGQTFE